MAPAPTPSFTASDLYLHVRVLISLIVGLAVTRLVSGVADFIQHPGRQKLLLVHLGWVVWALLNAVAMWWWEFRLSQIVHWTFGLYVFILLYASMYYLLAVLLFPEDLGEYIDFQDYFLSRRKWFFGMAILTELMDVVDTWIKGDQHMSALGLEYAARIVFLIVLFAIGAGARSLVIQRILVVLALICEVIFFSRHYGVLT